MLSDRQVTDFWRDGFVAVEDVFSGGEVEVLRAACLHPDVKGPLEERHHERTHVHLLEITTRHPAFFNLAKDARIVDKVAQLIGGHLQLQHSKLAAQPLQKSRGGFPWHQDFAFFQHTNTDLLAVMVYLDDATPQNGCLSMVRGSHRLGLLEHRREGWFAGGCQESKYLNDPSRRTPLAVKAGGISLHHCLTLHGSSHNKSGRPRRGIVFQYRSDDAYQLCDTVFQDTGWQVRGAFREQVRCDAGPLYLSKRKGWDPAFGNMYFQAGAKARAWNAPPCPANAAAD